MPCYPAGFAAYQFRYVGVFLLRHNGRTGTKAWFEMLARDKERLQDCLKRVNIMPLGAAALAGTSYPIDREMTAELLGFSRPSANSLDSVSDRDFAIEFTASASIIMMHLSRFSEELVLWASAQFDFIELIK
jgi:argininosuccinate lyase